MKRKWTVLITGVLLCAVLFGGCRLVSRDPVNTVLDVTGQVSVLDVSVGAADLRIEESDSFRVETDNPYIEIHQRNDTLIIREKPHVANLESSSVTIYYPADTAFTRAELEMGAGRLNAFSLSCDHLDLELGAGSVDIQLLYATRGADISGGAGEIRVSDGALHNLELEHGVGECFIRSLLTGSTDIEAGMGQLKVYVVGDMADYTIRATTGIGEILVNGTEIPEATFGTGANRIEISGGVGSVELYFES